MFSAFFVAKNICDRHVVPFGAELRDMPLREDLDAAPHGGLLKIDENSHVAAAPFFTASHIPRQWATRCTRRRTGADGISHQSFGREAKYRQSRSVSLKAPATSRASEGLSPKI